MSIRFDDLREANNARQQNWPGNEQADIAFRALEVGGECGEALEKVKKYLRAHRGIMGSTASIQEIGEELADVVISVDLLCQELGLQLGEEVSAKFNKTSIKHGLKERL